MTHARRRRQEPERGTSSSSRAGGSEARVCAPSSCAGAGGTALDARRSARSRALARASASSSGGASYFFVSTSRPRATRSMMGEIAATTVRSPSNEANGLATLEATADEDTAVAGTSRPATPSAAAEESERGSSGATGPRASNVGVDIEVAQRVMQRTTLRAVRARWANPHGAMRHRAMKHSPELDAVVTSRARSRMLMKVITLTREDLQE